MVRARPDNDSSNAFSIDDDEDMDQLLLDAANSGSAAVAEQDEGSFSDFDMGGESTVSTPSADIDFGILSDEPTAPPAPVEEVAPVAVPAPAAETYDSGDAIDNMLAELETQRLAEVAAAPAPTTPPQPEPVYVPEQVYVPEPEPAYVAPVEPPRVEPIYTPEPAYVAPTPEPYVAPQPAYVEPTRQPTVQPSPSIAPTPRSLTMNDQIELAKRVVATVDVYRSLTAEAKDVVAQLLAPTSDDLSQDEGTVAIRAIYAEPLQESTQRALIEAKNASPVDRVFYVLALPKDVLRYLGELVHAYSGMELPNDGNELNFAKGLVDAIDKLNREPIIYAEAMAKVLEAAQK